MKINEVISSTRKGCLTFSDVNSRPVGHVFAGAELGVFGDQKWCFLFVRTNADGRCCFGFCLNGRCGSSAGSPLQTETNLTETRYFCQFSVTIGEEQCTCLILEKSCLGQLLQEQNSAWRDMMYGLLELRESGKIC